MLLATVLMVAGLLAGCSAEETKKGSEELTAPTQETEIVEETTAPRERTQRERTQRERTQRAHVAGWSDWGRVTPTADWIPTCARTPPGHARTA